MADIEAGMYAGNDTFNPDSYPVNHEFATLMLKGQASTLQHHLLPPLCQHHPLLPPLWLPFVNWPPFYLWYSTRNHSGEQLFPQRY